MGDQLAEKNSDYRDDLLRDDPRLLVTLKPWTISECDRPDSWLHTFDNVDGVDEETISQKLIW